MENIPKLPINPESRSRRREVPKPWVSQRLVNLSPFRFYSFLLRSPVVFHADLDDHWTRYSKSFFRNEKFQVWWSSKGTLYLDWWRSDIVIERKRCSAVPNFYAGWKSSSHVAPQFPFRTARWTVKCQNDLRNRSATKNWPYYWQELTWVLFEFGVRFKGISLGFPLTSLSE